MFKNIDASIFLIIAIAIVAILILIQAINLVVKIFKKVVKAPVSKLVNKGKKRVGIRMGVIRKSFTTMNTKQRNKSLLYKYYQSMNRIIEALSLQRETNVESLFFAIIIISLIITILTTLSLPKFLMILVFIIMVLTIHSVLLFLSRVENISRILAVMNAEDLICASMEEGIVVAVSKSIPFMDKKVQQIFIEFEMSITKVNGTNIEDAIDTLNLRIGPQFDRFCERAVNHYKDGDNTVLAGFKENIRRNTKRRILLKEQNESYKVSLFYYFVLLGVCAIFTLIMSTMLGSGFAYFATLHGRICLILSICVSLLGFVASQLIYSGGVK